MSNMDFYHGDEPSTSQASPSKTQEDLLMIGDMACESPSANPSDTNTTENQEQQSSFSINDISRRAQEMVEKINDNRTSDQKVMDTFQEKLMEKVSEMCQQMKELMYKVYEENSDEMQVKLQELSQVLETCNKLNQELLEAGQALSQLREGLSTNRTPAV